MHTVLWSCTASSLFCPQRLFFHVPIMRPGGAGTTFCRMLSHNHLCLTHLVLHKLRLFSVRPVALRPRRDSIQFPQTTSDKTLETSDSLHHPPKHTDSARSNINHSLRNLRSKLDVINCSTFHHAVDTFHFPSRFDTCILLSHFAA